VKGIWTVEVDADDAYDVEAVSKWVMELLPVGSCKRLQTRSLLQEEEVVEMYEVDGDAVKDLVSGIAEDVAAVVDGVDLYFEFDVDGDDEQLEEVDGSIEPEHEDVKEWSLSW